MYLKTRYNLWKLKRTVSPSMVFKATLRKNLNIAWSVKYGGKVTWYQTGMARLATGFAMITLLLSGGGGVYAYTSPEVTEGSALYSVKQAIETVEEITKITPEAKAKFYIKKIERREAERVVLEKKFKLPEMRQVKIEEKIQEDIKQEKKKEIKQEREDVKKVIKEQTQEIKAKIRVEAEERKIKRTEKSIERIEEQLEKTRQIIEKTESKNIKLREELKNRADKKLERVKKQLEIQAEKQKNTQEKLQELRQRDGVKIKVRNSSSLNR